MKKIKILITLFLLFVSVNSAYAYKLPEELKTYIKKEMPKSKVRFDGILVTPDGSVYLPIIPSYLMKDVEIKIKSTYPKGVTLKSNPEVVVFSNNFAFLKLTKSKDGHLRITDIKNIPTEALTGILPQDMMVPKGLVLQDEMKSILGDLKIPLTSEIKIVAPQKPTKSSTPAQKNVQFTNLPLGVKNKLYYVGAFDSPFLTVFNSDYVAPQFSLKLPNIPSDIKADNTGQYLLIACKNENFVDVLDASTQAVIKQIDLQAIPDEILISKDNTAYISSINAKSIFVVDLNTMKMSQKINTKGMAQRLTLSDDERKLAYYDKSSSKIFAIELDNSFMVREVLSVPNTYKILFNKGILYALSRTDDKLVMVNYYEIDFDKEKKAGDLAQRMQIAGYFSMKNFNAFKGEKGVSIFDEENTTKKEVQKIDFATSKKPVDMHLYKGKIYILSAQENAINVFDVEKSEMIKTVKLPIKGFSKSLVPVKNTSYILVTNILENKYVLFDLNKDEVVKVVNIEMPISILTITDKLAKPKI